MNEADIATKVAQNIPREQPVVAVGAPVPASPADPGDEGYVFDNPLDEVSMLRLYSFLEIPLDVQKHPETNTMMNKIVEWASQRGAVEYFDVVAQIRELQRMIGGEVSIKKIYEYTKLSMMQSRLDREMGALYG